MFLNHACQSRQSSIPDPTSCSYCIQKKFAKEQVHRFCGYDILFLLISVLVWLSLFNISFNHKIYTNTTFLFEPVRSMLYTGEYHLDLIVGYGAVPVIVPRVSGIHKLLESFEPILVFCFVKERMFILLFMKLKHQLFHPKNLKGSRSCIPVILPLIEKRTWSNSNSWSFA